MKALKAAYLILIILIIAVSLNSYYIGRVSEKLTEELYKAETSDDFEKLYKNFKKASDIISLTVSHDDLTNIEEGLAEIIGASQSNEKGTVITIKSRLIESFKHLRRLSGINPDSIL